MDKFNLLEKLIEEHFNEKRENTKPLLHCVIDIHFLLARLNEYRPNIKKPGGYSIRLSTSLTTLTVIKSVYFNNYSVFPSNSFKASVNWLFKVPNASLSSVAACEPAIVGSKYFSIFSYNSLSSFLTSSSNEDH